MPARDYLPDHHVRRNYFSHNYFYVGGHALPEPQLELNLEPTAHSARHALLHTAPKWSSHQTTWAGRLTELKGCQTFHKVVQQHIEGVVGGNFNDDSTQILCYRSPLLR